MTNNISKSVTVGTTTVKISENLLPEQRKSILIQNNSTGGQIVTLGIGTDAISGVGIVLSPGGFYQDSENGEYYPDEKQITAISDVAGAKISVFERIA